MSGRKIALFSILFAVVIAVAMWFAVKKARPTAENRNPLAGVEAEAVSKIMVESPDGAVTLESADGRWTMTAPVADTAESENVLGLSTALTKFSVGAVVSERKDKWDTYGVSEASATRVRVYLTDASQPALDGFFGRQAFGHSSVYFRFADEEPVHLVNDIALWRLRQTPESYRSAVVFDGVDFSAVTRIEAALDDLDVHLTRSSETWTAATGAVVEPSVASGLLNQLETLRSSGFAAAGATAPATGLDASSATVTVSGDGFSRTLAIGSPVEPAPPEPTVYAAVDGRDAVFFLDTAHVVRLKDRFAAAVQP